MLSRVGPLVFALAFILAFHVAPPAAHAYTAAQADFVQGARNASSSTSPSAGHLLSSAQVDRAAQVIETIRRMPRTHAVRTTDTQFAMATGKPAIPAEIVANRSFTAAQVRMADARVMGAPVRAPPTTICIL